MGGLISLYAVCRYPEVFSGAGCISTAWNFGRGVLIPYFSQILPDPANHRLYFDMGGKETDIALVNRRLLKDQARIDDFARQAGYVDGESLLTLVAHGHKHHESAWQKRVDEVFKFLLGK